MHCKQTELTDQLTPLTIQKYELISRQFYHGINETLTPVLVQWMVRQNILFSVACKRKGFSYFEENKVHHSGEK